MVIIGKQDALHVTQPLKQTENTDTNHASYFLRPILDVSVKGHCSLQASYLMPVIKKHISVQQ